MKMFKINRLKVEGEKKCDYSFETGLNIIQGYHDTGKTNLIEILRFSLGGSGRYIDNSIYDYIDYVYCEFILGTEIYTVKRKKSKSGQKIDLIKKSIEKINSDTKWERLNIGDLSNIILNYFEVNGEYFRGRGLKKGKINFPMMFNLIYIPQRNWRGIQQSQQIGNYHDRIATFKFSLDIEEEKKRELTLKGKMLEKEREELGRKRGYYVSILNEQFIEDVDKIKEEISILERKIDEINNDIEEYKRKQEDKFNQNIKNYRNELNKLSRDYEKYSEEFQEIDNKIISLLSFKSEIESRFSTLSFDKTAYKKLHPINFTFCPSCRQKISKNLESSTCDLCKQKIELDLSDFEIEREVAYLRDTIDEVEYDITLLYKDLNENEERMQRVILKQKELRNLIKKNIEIDSIPLIDNLSNLYNSRQQSEKKIEQYKAYLKLWDYSNTINKEIEIKEKELNILEEKISKLDKEFTIEEKIEKIESVYKNLLNEFSNIRKIDNIKLSLKQNNEMFFPIINGIIYTKETGGAELTIRIISYYLTLLILFKKGLAKFPPILVIDTPRQQELYIEDYNKLLDILHLYSKNVQIFICITEDIHLKLEKYNHLFFEKGNHTIK